MTPPTSLKLDPELKERLYKVAAAHRRSPHWMMREAVAEFVAREEDALEADADAAAAWEEFQRTRMGVPHEEVEVWLDSLARGEDAPPPSLRRIENI